MCAPPDTPSPRRVSIPPVPGLTLRELSAHLLILVRQRAALGHELPPDLALLREACGRELLLHVRQLLLRRLELGLQPAELLVERGVEQQLLQLDHVGVRGGPRGVELAPQLHALQVPFRQLDVEHRLAPADGLHLLLQVTA